MGDNKWLRNSFVYVIIMVAVLVLLFTFLGQRQPDTTVSIGSGSSATIQCNGTRMRNNAAGMARDRCHIDLFSMNGPVGAGFCTDYALARRPDLNGKVNGNAAVWRDQAIAAGEAPKELNASRLLDAILTSLEQNGPSCGMGRDAFTPGLLPGVGGVAYQLLRAHPEHDLPSILAPGAFSRVPGHFQSRLAASGLSKT